MPSELSGGMKKRVALARSIIFDDTKEEIEPEVFPWLIMSLGPFVF
jgi:ABC-type transporter Mla maintaining outer membrane lipid asymmetry ATPase subunit MlaF